MKYKNLLPVAVGIVVLIVLSVIIKLLPHKNDLGSANSAISSISSDGDWSMGTSNNLTINSGNISINNKNEVAQAITSCSTTGVGDVSNVTDGNTSTYVTLNNHNGTLGPNSGDSITCTIDSSIIYKKIRIYAVENLTGLAQGKLEYQDSLDAWHTISEDVGTATLAWSDISISPPNYVKSLIYTNYSHRVEPTNFQKIGELQILSNGTATHTTQAIDGGENFWSWDANTITQTVPANTSATYQYRTSSNGSDWTAWVGAIGSVTNRTGDDDNNPTRYRYLQIKATLTNTDGVSTPTIDAYNIDYHTEVKPGVPTAQTAVVQ